MKIKLYGDISNKTIVATGMVVGGLFDPDKKLEKDETDVAVTIELRISKQGNLVAIVKDKSKI